MTNISIIGVGGHTRSSINLLKSHFTDAEYKIFDDSFMINTNEYISDIQLAGKVTDIDPETSVFLSIGDNFKRETFFNLLKRQLIKQSIFHNSAHIEEHVKIGDSNQFFANCYVNSYSIIGDNNIINTSSIIEHEVKIGNHNHISIGAKICGRVTIGNNCMIGASAIVIDKVTICDNVIVGAGAVVTKDIKQRGTYIGVPARKIK
ncbi:MAG: acetyltransferase [Bacteroidales bacterium]|nr:acetyltransferase [Bacteroidales bacterium]